MKQVAPSRKKWRISSKSSILYFLLGLLLFGGIIYFGGEESLHKLTDLSLFPMLGAFLATFGITASITYRWGLLVNSAAGEKIASWIEYYYYFILSRLAGLILPRDASDIICRSVCLKYSKGLNWTFSGTSVFADRIFDFLLSAFCLIVVLPFWLGLMNAQHNFMLLILMVFLGTAFLVIYKNTFLNIFFRFLAFCFAQIYKILPIANINNNDQIYKDFNFLKHNQIFLFLIIASISKLGFTIVRLLFFSYALKLSINPLIIILGAPIGQFAYLFAITPGGLGVFEAGWYAILRLSGVSVNDALAFVIGQRFLTIILICAWAAISQIMILFKYFFKVKTK